MWNEKVKDYILALDCEGAEDISEAFIWTPDPVQAPADQADPALDYGHLPNGTVVQRKTRRKHAAAFSYIQNALSPAVVQRSFQKEKSRAH